MIMKQKLPNRYVILIAASIVGLLTGSPAPKTNVSGSAVKSYTTKEMLCTPLYWVLLLAMICALCSGVMLTGQASAVVPQQN